VGGSAARWWGHRQSREWTVNGARVGAEEDTSGRDGREGEQASMKKKGHMSTTRRGRAVAPVLLALNLLEFKKILLVHFRSSCIFLKKIMVCSPLC
jgi:hypothetical protein